jgi:glutamate racemase
MRSSLLNSQAIGVMDSGVGGISVLKHIHALLPNEHLIYAADSKHAPYGNKTPQQIESRVFSTSKFLLAHGAKALVVACNTATAAAISALRDKYAFLNIPIIGMEPAVKPAAAASSNGKIGVLATVGTLKSAQFAALLEKHGQHVQVFTQGCEGLVECIERGELSTANTYALLEKYCMPLLEQHVDTIVLGCTHYPFIKEAIQTIVGPKIHLIDTGAAVASQLQRKLTEHQMLAPAHTPTITFYTNSTAPNAAHVIKALWQGNPVHLLPQPAPVTVHYSGAL